MATLSRLALVTVLRVAVVGALAACGFDGGVPLPRPTCFDTPTPTSTARFVDSDAGARVVEVTIAFSEPVTLSSVSGTDEKGQPVEVESSLAGTVVTGRFAAQERTLVRLDVIGMCSGNVGFVRVSVAIAGDAVTATVL